MNKNNLINNYLKLDKYIKDKVKNNSIALKELKPLKLKIKEDFKKIKKNIDFVNVRRFMEFAQDRLEQSVRKNNEEISLNQTTFWAKGITWLIIGGTSFGIGWLAIAKTDEIVMAPGELEPLGGVVEIKMPLNGITEQVLIKEGQKVLKGETLIKLDNSITKARLSASSESLILNTQILKNMEKLAVEGAISQFQYLQQKNKVINLKKENIENQITNSYQNVTSPVEGYVFDLQPSGPGYVARSSEPVLKIVPTNKLYAKIEIPSRSIGFVSVGKKVDISISSFPASDFGVIQGTITKISSDALQPDRATGKGYRFPADVQLDNQTLNLVNGSKLPLQVGMSLTANIKLRKVSYLQILLNTFNEKSKSLTSI